MKRFLAPVILISLCGFAFAQSTYTVLYNFGAYTGDGAEPAGGLLSDAAGNLYGVTASGGAYCASQGGCGTVYELSPANGGIWTETILYNFCPTEDPPFCLDGSVPFAGLVADRSGNLYGTTLFSGTSASGVVYRLSPPTSKGGTWTETVLWNFALNKKNNGYGPGDGKLNIDAVGNIYGTTTAGGAKNKGIVFELSPVGDGTYIFSILHSFSGPDGADPQYGVAIDSAGNLYGTTEEGGKSNANCIGQCGLVYKLSQFNGTWKETVLYGFNGTNGANPISPISIDVAGNLFGTFYDAGEDGTCDSVSCGGVFKLVPKVGGGGKAYTFLFDGQNGGAPQTGVLVPPPSDVLYGTTTNGPGNVFSIRGKTETVLYQFCSLPNCTDGSFPAFGTLIEHAGVLYGAAELHGLYGFGVVYSITK
jgi:uncharacterized repeat protein (TIGR03803 family)